MTADHIDVADRGEEITLPLVDILTGRGFVTGKSGSGKSTSVNVVVEEILDLRQPLLIVDTDGEYWGLKEHYQILHLGNDDQCDVRVTSTDAETIVDLALVEKVPIILDISGFMHTEDAQEVLNRVVRELFHREKTLKEPFLLIVEEVHEYIPESGGLTDVGETLIQVAKRGRKHGLGFCGVSQRPASVDKDFITQCDWIVWHRLTWKNDTEVVRTILGSDYAETVQDLDPGEALLMSDWDEQVKQVQFRQKRTFDAGATPGFEDFQPPELVPVNPAIVNRFDERRVNVDYGDLDGSTEGTDEAATEGGGADPRGGADATGQGEADDTEDQADDGEEAVPETVPLADDPTAAASADSESSEEATDSETADPETADPEPADGATGSETAEAATGSSSADTTEAELVPEPAERERPARTADRGSGRRARPGGGTSTPPTNTSEGVVVEFAQLVLFLAGRTRAAVAGLVLGAAGTVGGAARWVEARTRLASEDVLVAGWLALVVLAILALSAALVAVL